MTAATEPEHYAVLNVIVTHSTPYIATGVMRAVTYSRQGRTEAPTEKVILDTKGNAFLEAARNHNLEGVQRLLSDPLVPLHISYHQYEAIALALSARAYNVAAYLFSQVTPSYRKEAARALRARLAAPADASFVPFDALREAMVTKRFALFEALAEVFDDALASNDHELVRIAAQMQSRFHCDEPMGVLENLILSREDSGDGRAFFIAREEGKKALLYPTLRSWRSQGV